MKNLRAKLFEKALNLARKALSWQHWLRHADTIAMNICLWRSFGPTGCNYITDKINYVNVYIHISHKIYLLTYWLCQYVYFDDFDEEKL